MRPTHRRLDALRPPDRKDARLLHARAAAAAQSSDEGALDDQSPVSLEREVYQLAFDEAEQPRLGEAGGQPEFGGEDVRDEDRQRNGGAVDLRLDDELLMNRQFLRVGRHLGAHCRFD